MLHPGHKKTINIFDLKNITIIFLPPISDRKYPLFPKVPLDFLLALNNFLKVVPHLPIKLFDISLNIYIYIRIELNEYRL